MYTVWEYGIKKNWTNKHTHEPKLQQSYSFFLSAFDIYIRYLFWLNSRMFGPQQAIEAVKMPDLIDFKNL